MAVLLSNESNLRIIEMLKSRPYYPRELAAEMSLSEPFVVRRLRLLEENGIVEGRWESNGSRRVKRYFLKDLTLELGKTGLKIRMENAPAQYAINFRGEAIKWAIALPFIVIALYGIFFRVMALVLIFSIYFIWYGAINFAYYREFGLRSNVLGVFIDLFVAFIISVNTIEERVTVLGLGIATGIIAITVGIAIIVLMTYRIRYRQLEFSRIDKSKTALMDNISSGPSYVKVFYLPIAIKWKIYEYFDIALV